ncbi:MAG: 6,7-dimethyl-8-ribityllumazine synthase [Flavobacteriales bacterium]|nr:6,7-dimethyl-8-ribityllumazine synthase [Flavobacteriales bacterium]MBK7554328.1 6,7-dimethyl-8-ribityllumazine synthase [Flavobacteriales bacterium]MBK9194635.1 6,7-dimethyl-8-ribityllumazine synthase [Flavobacteriales bacterium]MBP6573644.1 6,7-dimethyl-8-ribityllumazine synthase [Flavobacteriales bacterium]
MATSTTNLSHYDTASVPDASAMRIGIVVSEWNRSITTKLLDGARETLLKCGVKPENITVEYAPGSFELPTAAQFLLDTLRIDGVICLGSVVRGETPHFDFICQSTANGIMNCGLRNSRPVIFGVLTDDTMEQAEARSGGQHGNKGVDSAIACIKMVALRKKMRESSR